jgi:hypothetical protein
MPTGILICGGPGTGKSTNVNKIVKLAKIRSFFTVDPDQLRNEPNPSDRAIEMVHEHISARKNVVYVGTCRRIKYMKDILDNMKAHGYRTIVAIVYTSLPTAIKRVEMRKHQPVSEEALRYMYSSFKRNAPEYVKLNTIDELYFFNNEDTFTLLFSKIGNETKLHNEELDFYF